MIIFVHFYFPFSVHCYIIIYKYAVGDNKFLVHAVEIKLKTFDFCSAIDLIKDTRTM